MTVIAYRDGIMAADSQVTTHEGVITGAIRKIRRRRDGALCAAAGSAGDSQSFAAWFCASAAEAPPWEGKDRERGFAGFTVTLDGVVTLYDVEGRGYAVEAPFYARGAGAELALGAMAMGARADQAVEIACSFSGWCRGPVQVERLAVPVEDSGRKAAVEQQLMGCRVRLAGAISGGGR